MTGRLRSDSQPSNFLVSFRFGFMAEGLSHRRFRFAILRHDFPFLHWDLLLQTGASCRTWRLLEEPKDAGPWLAQPVNDHRLLYLDYEGPVSGNRGQVSRWDGGLCEWQINTDSQVAITLAGNCWSGRFAGRHNAVQEDWLFWKEELSVTPAQG